MADKTIKNAREIAYLALLSMEKDKAWSDGALTKLLSDNKLETRDAALATHMCYGVIQNKFMCDFYISHYSKTKIAKLEKSVLCILRLGIYQLVFMDKIPPNAAVNECVNLVKKYDKPHLTGFVNGVLRQIVRDIDKLPNLNCDTKEEYLSLKYSHPLWFVKKIFDRFGRVDAEKILKANNDVAPVTLRVNTLNSSIEAVSKELNSHGIEFEVSNEIPNVITCKAIGNLNKITGFQDGDFTVQDISSQLAALALSPLKGSFVIDCCSAPGGKSFLMADLMQNEGRILSCDIHEHKIDIIDEGASRLGIDIIDSVVLDASKPFDRLLGTADFVLCDVPCSGMGIIRKKPEIRYKDYEDIKDLPSLQYKILETGARYLKKDGIMVYSTCTILPEENSEVVEKFLENNKSYELVSFELPKYGQISSGMLNITQGIDDSDGFFIAKLKRIEL